MVTVVQIIHIEVFPTRIGLYALGEIVPLRQIYESEPHIVIEKSDESSLPVQANSKALVHPPKHLPHCHKAHLSDICLWSVGESHVENNSTRHEHPHQILGSFWFSKLRTKIPIKTYFLTSGANDHPPLRPERKTFAAF